MLRSLRASAVEVMRSFRTSPVFSCFVLVTLGLAAFIGLLVGQMALRIDFFLPGQFGQMGHGQMPAHRVHDLAFGFLFAPAVVGVLAQLRRPSKNVAGMLMTLIPFVGLLMAAVFSTDAMVMLGNPAPNLAALMIITALLHPTGRAFFRSFRISRVNWPTLVLLIIAALPLLAFASTNIRLQATIPDDHAAMGHYGFMAALAFTVIGTGILASLRPDGWRLTAWIAGFLPVLFGVTSLTYPSAASSLSEIWALAAIAWGVMFVTVSALTKDPQGPTLARSREPERDAVPAT